MVVAMLHVTVEAMTAIILNLKLQIPSSELVLLATTVVITTFSAFYYTEE